MFIHAWAGRKAGADAPAAHTGLAARLRQRWLRHRSQADATADDSSPALELVGCRLSGHPAASGAGGDGATAPAFVYGPELCPAAHRDACRAGRISVRLLEE